MKKGNSLRVLAAIVIPPHLVVSGAVNAAKSLSQAVAEHCQVDIALMSNVERHTQLGEATLFERKSTNLLSFTRSILPDKFRTLLYRSDISDLVSPDKYDLVHLHNAIPTLEMQRIAKACVARGVSYVISTHGFVEITSKDQAYSLKFHEKIAGKLLIDRPLRYVVQHAAKVFAGSPCEMPLLRKLEISTDKISIVTNGVNEYFLQTPTCEQTAQAINKFELPPKIESSPITYFYLGNHTQNKGLPILLESLMQITEPYLMIVGGKKRNIIDYEHYIARCRAGQRIVFTDLLSDEEVLALAHYSDLFIFPTLADTLPLVILEAMACGLPILATEIGGIPYQVKPECGHLVQPGDPIALGNALKHLSMDKELLKEMGKAARHRVETVFRWKEVAHTAFVEYNSIFQTKIDGNKPV